MYFILALPRSRTTWLSALLCTDHSTCHHDKSMDFSTLGELKDWCDKNPDDGICDTALLQHWKWLVDNIDAKFILIERDYQQALSAVKQAGFPTDNMPYLQAKLMEMKQHPKVLTVNFEYLNKELYCKQLYEYCTGIPLNEGKWNLFRKTDIKPYMPLELEEIKRKLDNVKSLYGAQLC